MVDVALFTDGDGSEPVMAYIAALRAAGTQSDAAAITRTIDLLIAAKATELQSQRLARQIDSVNKIWELRPGRHRVAFAVVDGTWVLLHAWRKQTQKLDAAELRIAQRRLAAL